VTARLVLSAIGPGDVDDLELLCSDPLVALWTGPWTPLTVRSWAVDMETRWARDGVGKWMARDRSDASLVGRGGFSMIELDGEKVLELGWAVRDRRAGRGYATELGTAALHWAAQRLPDVPVVAFTEVHNRASRAVAQKLGMYAAGVIERPGLVEGEAGMQQDAPFALYRT
jgi:RimJ/RimL family protein N-acetyltransferase